MSGVDFGRSGAVILCCPAMKLCLGNLPIPVVGDGDTDEALGGGGHFCLWFTSFLILCSWIVDEMSLTCYFSLRGWLNETWQ